MACLVPFEHILGTTATAISGRDDVGGGDKGRRLRGLGHQKKSGGMSGEDKKKGVNNRCVQSV